MIKMPMHGDGTRMPPRAGTKMNLSNDLTGMRTPAEGGIRKYRTQGMNSDLTVVAAAFFSRNMTSCTVRGKGSQRREPCINT